jgi:hypothetical protein
MNKIKSFIRLTALCLFLSAGLFACKSSKKAADKSASDNAPKPEAAVTPETPTTPVKVEVREDLDTRLDNYFNAIAASTNNNTAANRNMNEAKSLFASADVPVLIIIHESADGTKDYDEPTTILNYMNYLKDQGKNLNRIYDVETNANGKITTLELIRK